MSGGTWDYLDHRLFDLAESLRDYANVYAERNGEPPTHDLPRARAAVADLMQLAGDLAHELDWHLAGDSEIPDETTWLAGASERLEALVTAFPHAR